MFFSSFIAGRMMEMSLREECDWDSAADEAVDMQASPPSLLENIIFNIPSPNLCLSEDSLAFLLGIAFIRDIGLSLHFPLTPDFRQRTQDGAIEINAGLPFAKEFKWKTWIANKWS